MSNSSFHTFHIPVMGLGSTIDTLIKVAKFGISSVVSIKEDDLIEEMKKFYSKNVSKQYLPISSKDVDRKCKRIMSYLNVMNNYSNLISSIKENSKIRIDLMSSQIELLKMKRNKLEVVGNNAI